MTMRKGLPAKKALTDADDTRYDWLNDVVTNADGSPRGGITSPVATNLISGQANMTVNVGRFAAVAPRDGGAIKLANDGTINLAVPAAPASGTRTHVIAARQNDSSSTVTTPDGDDIAKVYVIPDTGAGQPALPDGSVLLGTIAISAGQTTTNAATITQATQYTASAGAAVPFRTLAQLRAWTTARAYQLAVVQADTAAGNNGLWAWDSVNTKWKAVAPIGGTVATGANPTGQVIITFPAGHFTAVPQVVVSLASFSSNVQILKQAVSATQTTIVTYAIGSGAQTPNVAFDWIAFEP